MGQFFKQKGAGAQAELNSALNLLRGTEAAVSSVKMSLRAVPRNYHLKRRQEGTALRHSSAR